MPAIHLTPAEYGGLLSEYTAGLGAVDQLVERAEAVVLGQYAERNVYGNHEIMLDGYDTDNTAIDAGLLRALRITIALVAEHLAWGPDPRLRMLVRGARTVVYGGTARLLPPGWDAALAPYDATTPCYRI